MNSEYFNNCRICQEFVETENSVRITPRLVEKYEKLTKQKVKLFYQILLLCLH